MSRNPINKMLRHRIRWMREELGISAESISAELNVPLSTVYYTLSGKYRCTGEKTADYAEAILGGIEATNGCTRTLTPSSDENPVRSEYRALQEVFDPVFDGVALFEEREEDIRRELKAQGVDVESL